MTDAKGEHGGRTGCEKGVKYLIYELEL